MRQHPSDKHPGDTDAAHQRALCPHGLHWGSGGITFQSQAAAGSRAGVTRPLVEFPVGREAPLEGASPPRADPENFL